jgi:hypothetical protein
MLSTAPVSFMYVLTPPSDLGLAFVARNLQIEG